MSHGNIEDIYELSPLQRGMLLHSAHDGAADMYVSQQTHVVAGPLDVDALIRAWELAIAAHPALRATFHWDGADKPLQVVHRVVSLPAERADWSGLDEAAQAERLDQLRAEHRAAGFRVTEPPLQRLHLIRLGPDRHTLVWTYHHLLLDGWSIPIFMNYVVAHYCALTIGSPPPPPAPAFSEYLAWLQRQELDTAKGFWVDRLSGVRPSHLLPLRAWDARRGTGVADRRIVGLPTPVERGLRAAAARHQVTIGTVVQAAWAVVLRHFSGSAQITFGSTSSGRPDDLPGVERMVGVFANTLPVVVTVPDDGDLGPWLRDLQQRYAATRRYEYTPLADIKRWAGAPGQQLFESLLVFENYPSTIVTGDAIAGLLSFRRTAIYDKINMPLTLTFAPEPASELHLLFHRDRFAPEFIDDVLSCLHTTFEAIATADRIGAVASAAGPLPPAGPLPSVGPGPTAEPERPVDRTPPTPEEAAIAAVYRDVLGVPEVDLTASFFELGGDSFDAVRATGRIEGASVALLATHQSVRELARALHSPGAGPDGGAGATLLRRLGGPADPARTLVCVPFGGGSAISYQPLARALPADFALLAVALPGHEPGGDPELRPLEDVARECAAELQSIDGDIYIYGHSAGVALAVELARRLAAAGRPTRRLFLAASYPVFEYGPIGRTFQRRREHAAALLPELEERRAGGPDDGVDLTFVARAASHDVAAARRYFSARWPRGASPLAVPITVVANPDDPATPRVDRRYRRWARFGSAVDLALVTGGGHDFHQHQAPTLAGIIEQRVGPPPVPVPAATGRSR